MGSLSSEDDQARFRSVVLPHLALLGQGGIYASLWNRQSGGFLGVE